METILKSENKKSLMKLQPWKVSIQLDFDLQYLNLIFQNFLIKVIFWFILDSFSGDIFCGNVTK